MKDTSQKLLFGRPKVLLPQGIEETCNDKPFFIKISTFNFHNSAIDTKGNLYSWGIKY